MKRKVLNIAVVLQMSFSSHRDLLFGISRYAKARHWRIKLICGPENFTRETLCNLDAEGIDGMITYGCGGHETAEYLSLSKTPLVIIGSRERGLARRHHKIAFVRNNDMGIGRQGALHLLSLGRFRAFGFVPENTPTPCTLLRLRGFTKALQGKAEHLSIYEAPAGALDGSSADLSGLSKWVAALPKPAAVMTVYDLRATHLLEVASHLSIQVPFQLAVLGVDNDELLCDFTEPTLSSISPDYETAGEQSATTLARLIQSRSKGELPDVYCHNTHIVQRESTAPIVPGATIVSKAVSLIRKKALAGISPAEVTAGLGVSRRLAELRYKQFTGESMLHTLLDIRLSAVQDKLKNTQLPIARITTNCGFRNQNYAKNLFKKRFGMSMREWRRLKQGV